MDNLTPRRSPLATLGVLLSAALLVPSWVVAEPPNLAPTSENPAPQVEAGRRMYREGILPSGERMTGIVQGDIPLSGEQVICGRCHRRSGMGAPEGQNVAPAVVGDILYQPLRLPTSKPPLPPERRPAYTDETLKTAIRQGIDPSGKPLGPLMPRYPLLSDAQLDTLIAYLKTLQSSPAPGVTERDMHFATVIAGPVESDTREAFLGVFHTFFDQKNRETRHESQRAAHAPWHKAWALETYRKWALHLWELQGPPETWGQQLDALYRQQPVFAVLSGIGAGSWEPVHHFCEANGVPCILPMTDLPVVEETDFYSLYFTRGMQLEADTIAEHLAKGTPEPVVQVYPTDDLRAKGAAERLRQTLQARGSTLADLAVAAGSRDDRLWQEVMEAAAGGTAVLWLGADDLEGLWTRWQADTGNGPTRIYLSTTLFGTEPGNLPQERRDQVFLVHASELPSRLPQRLVRSAGWLKSQRIAVPDAQVVQANAFFALKLMGEATKGIRGYYNRELLLERIEHMAENAVFTSVYPRLSLAPGQRFLSRGAYIAQFQAGDELVALTDWLIPGSQ